GKTTTTSLLGALLTELGFHPSVLVGGVALDSARPFRDGAGPHLVDEGVEYDTDLYDNTPKHLHYHPRTLLLSSAALDTADIYRDLEHVKQAFRTLVRGMPADGTIVAALDDPNVRDVVDGAPPRVVGYGLGDGSGFRALDLEPGPAGTAFRVLRDGEELA